MRSAVALRSSCRGGRDVGAITLARARDVLPQCAIAGTLSAGGRILPATAAPTSHRSPPNCAELSRFQEGTMNMTLSLAPLVSLLAGILILVVPRLLNYIVAIYLIVIGLLGLFGAGSFHLK